MRELILKYLKNRNKKRIKTRAIEDYIIKSLGPHRYRKQGGYQEFVKSIKILVSKELIRPIKAWKKNGMAPPLYNGYQILSLKEKLGPDIKKKLLTQYHPSLNTTYYLNNPQEYKRDKKYLSQLDEFLKENSSLELVPMTVNERSFQIFQDEKFLASQVGKEFMRRIGLSLEILNSYPTYEPFFYYQNTRGLDKRNLLIIENKDTFFSFKKLLQEGNFSWKGVRFDLIIYGEGKKIQHSFPFFYELKEYQKGENNLYYFGDLDPAGISIWYGLQEKFEEEFIPFTFFYNTLLAEYQEQIPKLKKKQKINQRAVQKFISFFSPKIQDKILELVESNIYLPQEGLNYSLLKNISD
ncbi:MULTISPECIES: Wadjet anti-phage system protein JetD domain-containing protein [unclassified Candidatus Frackibacter]|uniref:Wadjet anti-phage system protein JetD domain-containing protein n=1 Tax=unclassified Candidatus Frackibacter TaxID=2648818 RepID=UPI00088EB45C|nr:MULTISPECIES: Wadjet anti-phage system protein JetD domain-containing protein [unclassified Candidatus Frackibacter]SDC27412.1 hypothetical protein SAMN04515661_10570 [Candidatus Frackibacter sp. WG11]SEM54364.1 hypothetical protein SAMN04488698_10671 [Candidatus Frackibacter sp. WG12]SFL54024.1 hypothetical protein SAMN04488699_10523 [Candidatus Frackibacter sp. WG13]